MTITANTMLAAQRGIDFSDEMPEITDAMLDAGVAAVCPVDDVVAVDRVAVRAIFEAMWKARKLARESTQ